MKQQCQTAAQNARWSVASPNWRKSHPHAVGHGLAVVGVTPYRGGATLAKQRGPCNRIDIT
eukprot:3118454-Pyramimonas_sp.AAC.1